MENKISVITEASDKYFHQTRVAVHSFIKHNPWFDGTLYLLTISALPISQKNLDSLFKIYENLQIINLSSLSQVSNIETEFKKKNRDLDLLYRYLRLFVLQINVPNLLYFSSSSLFLGQASEIISQKNLYSTNTELSLFYVSDFKYRFDEIIESQIIKSEPIEKIFEQHALNYFYPFKDDCYNIASQFNDSLFNKKKNQLSSLKYLNYNTFYSKFSNCSNINRVWLQENHELQKFLNKPSSIKKEVIRVPVNIQNKKNINIREPNEIVKIINESKKNESKKVYHLDRSKLIKSLSDFEKIKHLKNSEPILSYATACVIAFKDRHSILELNVKLLNRQTLVPAIILVASNLEDSIFAKSLQEKYNNIFIVYHSNYPIGGKWQAGVSFAKKLNVKGVMILGSDDILSFGYFKECYSALDEGYGSSRNGVDLIGNRKWFLYDISKKMYSLEYKETVSILLGGGKMFSKNFLDSVDWKIFKEHRPFHLDEHGYNLVLNFSNSIKTVSSKNFILSIKGKWDMINTTDAIIRANSRISISDVTDNSINILNKLKIKNHETLDGVFI